MRRQQGYTLTILVIMITILSILLALALPYWSKQIQREKEEELIFRGIQYAEAIRVFRNRFGRPPTTLDELIKVKPRSIRKLWKDPMTQDGEWGLAFETALQAQGAGDPNQPQTGAIQLTPAQGPGELDPGTGRTLTLGPIAGVHSKSDKEALKLWNGLSKYNQWVFTYQLLTAPAGFGVPPAQPGGQPNVGLAVKRGEWIGRPFREGIAPVGGGLPGGGPINGSAPGQPLPGGKPGAPRQTGEEEQ
ncbi:MAG TPA: hypothetical protein PK413_09650 [Thermoanaerobaculia bacterium]|nr:hypothetical protein [Thermoanaerobaculia bacterium]